jgi:excinuclease ABC subunit C
MNDLEAKLAKLPTSPGVYLFKDGRHEVIYVGKAKNLRTRVRSYFHKSADRRAFYDLLTARIADVDFVVTKTEKEALILENNLIKQFQPRYNIRLRDEKTYISLKIDLNEPFPRIQFPRKAASRAEVERRKGEKGVLYFGPYASAKAARATVRFVNSVFPIRKCSNTVFGKRTRPCLNAQIGNCMGPCSGAVDEEAYREMLGDAILFLQGKNEEVLAALRKKMESAAAERDYERAARLRDRIAAIERTTEKQRITADRDVDRDVFGLFREGGRVAFQAMFVRRGRLEDVATYEFNSHGLPDAELLAEFLRRFYGQMRFTPPEVLVPVEPDDRATLEEWLAELRGGRARIAVPRRGSRRELVDMACRNAHSSFDARHTSRARARRLLESLQAKLELRVLPRRIECVDISNFRGRTAVGSLVRFRDAVPDKSGYRRFRIRTVEGSDDFAMMREVLRRRYREREDVPDLLLVDGGAGQVSAALGVLRELNLEERDLVGIAKSHRKAEPERFFKPGRPEPVILPPDSGELFLLERVRDEAHRFAIAYHKKLRGRSFLPSPLDDVPGLGPKRIGALRKHFGSLKAIEEASPQNLAEVPGISLNLARRIHHRLHMDE